MATKPKPYTKLSGRSTMSVQTSYLAEDHLLVLDGYYTETARKLYYKDIEAILITRTRAGTIWAVLSMIAAALFVVTALANSNELAAWIPLLIVAAMFAVFSVYTFYQQGSAIIGVQTSVQTATLDGVRTYRKARKVEAKLAERIESVQGRLTKEALEAALFKDAKPSPPPVATTAPPIPTTTRKPETEGDALNV